MSSWKYNGEEVARELWRWEAVYGDGTTLKQFDNDGVFHQFKEIDQDKLALFRMVNDVAAPVQIIWDGGRKLIHFYRNVVLRHTQPDEVRVKLYCFGYQEGSKKVIFVIMPDNTIILTDDVNKIRFGG